MKPLNSAPRKITVSVGLALLLGISGWAAFGPSNPKSMSERGYPLGDLEIRRKGAALVTLEVEIATTDVMRSIGLMGVKDLGSASGMVFLWKNPQGAGFWMKNTLIPLDIAFWDEQARIVDLFQMEPCRHDPCRIYQPKNAYVGAVEMNQGLLKKAGIRPGDEVLLKPRSKTDT